jgi:acyl carrier protein
MRKNIGRIFGFKRLGGRHFAQNEVQIGEETLAECAFGWDSLDSVVLS